MRLIAYPSVAILGAFLGACLANARDREKSQIRRDRKLREHLSGRQIDKMVEDSFPASDPPSSY